MSRAKTGLAHTANRLSRPLPGGSPNSPAQSVRRLLGKTRRKQVTHKTQVAVPCGWRQLCVADPACTGHATSGTRQLISQPASQPASQWIETTERTVLGHLCVCVRERVLCYKLLQATSQGCSHLLSACCLAGKRACVRSHLEAVYRCLFPSLAQLVC